ncbi:two component transcriptional regulator, LuxR family [Chitinophaga costaii]|uniref:Two component transcriptional regulator, LuxR family n=1 Tax=Chitinophaga costaii TaxID=1335309 RepID=A0A1C4DRT4_9BACT|nr:response regulator transcription factor [Chitinophaga costaii]PUZ27759.1 DNA-binding response regulator [Chitinophaga costaii]SCC34022.1 two component transcriptional regulator, LuxR family [Chitinophaga costaii]
MWQDNEKISLAIVDDHPVILHGLQTLLKDNPRIYIAGSFATGADFLAFLEKKPVQIVLLDIALPDIHGVALCKKIKQRFPTTCVLAFSNHSERIMIFKMLQSGASGYLLKNISAGELMTCISDAVNGQITFSSEVKQIMAHVTPTDLNTLPPLTKRERQLLHLIADGKTNNEIAELLSLSVLTIETHRKNLMQKFGVKNAAALIKAATAHHLL